MLYFNTLLFNIHYRFMKTLHKKMNLRHSYREKLKKIGTNG
jgi:hypothetical protein